MSTSKHSTTGPAPRLVALIGNPNSGKTSIFNGLTGFRWYMQYAEGERVTPQLGLQAHPIGQSRTFVAPNPSPANAAYSLETIAGWYRKLGELRDELKRR